LFGYLTVIRKIASRVIDESTNQTEGEHGSYNEESPLIQHQDTVQEREENTVSNEQKIIKTFKKINVQALALFCTFVVTLSLFPSVISGIESVSILCIIFKYFFIAFNIYLYINYYYYYYYVSLIIIRLIRIRIPIIIIIYSYLLPF